MSNFQSEVEEIHKGLNSLTDTQRNELLAAIFVQLCMKERKDVDTGIPQMIASLRKRDEQRDE